MATSKAGTIPKGDYNGKTNLQTQYLLSIAPQVELKVVYKITKKKWPICSYMAWQSSKHAQNQRVGSHLQRAQQDQVKVITGNTQNWERYKK